MLNIDLIKEVIDQIPYVKKVIFFEEDNLYLYGEIEITFRDLKNPLVFEIIIYPQYPLKSYHSESIKFINKDLLKYNHVMEDGLICIHTSHNTDIKQKLLIDFNSLKSWIEKYYINENVDENYEHIIVNENLINDQYYSYLFTDVDHEFKKGDFGKVKISLLNTGIFKEKNIDNYLVQGFSVSEEEIVDCHWSKLYKNIPSSFDGFYIFIEDHPARYNRFAFKKFNELENYIPSTFLDLLCDFEKDNFEKIQDEIVPIFIGYNTIKDETHWQIVLLEIGQFPLNEDYISKNNLLVPIKKLNDQNIKWAISRNSSYKYFFGRGTLSKTITNAKILIIGVGAIGSMIAKTLVKGGCKLIDIADYDIKEPENVCRSEYFFSEGITEKVYELQDILSKDSPFININIFKKEYFEEIIKTFSSVPKGKKDFASILNQYDIVFDCTTDNDLMYVLNLLKLNCDLINLSITNHAKDLVCAFYPNIYNFVNTQFNELLDNDLDDMYKPTGCWNTTFKASYTDIDLLVQIAIKKINNIYKNDKPKFNFVIKTENQNIFTLRINEY
ncbi:MAG: ThiF family adenylyltransferase [Cyanobacteria bacterium J06621_8]